MGSIHRPVLEPGSDSHFVFRQKLRKKEVEMSGLGVFCLVLGLVASVLAAPIAHVDHDHGAEHHHHGEVVHDHAHVAGDEVDADGHADVHGDGHAAHAHRKKREVHEHGAEHHHHGEVVHDHAHVAGDEVDADGHAEVHGDG